MSDIPTLEVPALFYDKAVAFCNERLAEDGKPLITELPAGKPCNPYSCPCATACGVSVGLKGWWSRRGEAQGFTGGPVEFVDFFDCHARGLTLPTRKAATNA